MGGRLTKVAVSKVASRRSPTDRPFLIASSGVTLGHLKVSGGKVITTSASATSAARPIRGVGRPTLSAVTLPAGPIKVHRSVCKIAGPVLMGTSAFTVLLGRGQGRSGRGRRISAALLQTSSCRTTSRKG